MTPSDLNTPVAPFLNSAALESVGAPLIIVIGPAFEPSSSIFFTSVWAWSLPTCSLSNEM